MKACRKGATREEEGAEQAWKKIRRSKPLDGRTSFDFDPGVRFPGGVEEKPRARPKSAGYPAPQHSKQQTPGTRVPTPVRSHQAHEEPAGSGRPAPHTAKAGSEVVPAQPPKAAAPVPKSAAAPVPNTPKAGSQVVPAQPPKAVAPVPKSAAAPVPNTPKAGSEVAPAQPPKAGSPDAPVAKAAKVPRVELNAPAPEVAVKIERSRTQESLAADLARLSLNRLSTQELESKSPTATESVAGRSTCTGDAQQEHEDEKDEESEEEARRLDLEAEKVRLRKAAHAKYMRFSRSLSSALVLH